MQEEADITCPFCWETISILLDFSIPEQEYIEDCQVCCRPMAFSLSVDPNGEILELAVRHEDD